MFGNYSYNHSVMTTVEYCIDGDKLLEYYCESSRESNDLRSIVYRCDGSCIGGRCCKGNGRLCGGDRECCSGMCRAIGLIYYCV